MVNFTIFAIVVLYAAVSVNAYAQSPSGHVAAGAAGAQYGQQTGGSETHDKKNFGLNFSSDKGSSNQFSNTNAQAGAAGATATGYYPPHGWGVPGGWGGVPVPHPGGWGVLVPHLGGWGVPVPQVRPHYL